MGNVVTDPSANYQRERPLNRWDFNNSIKKIVAVHYDTKNGHLIALSHDGHLIWNPRYRETIGAADYDETFSQHYVVTYLGEYGHNLCVENGRAVISTLTAIDDDVVIESIHMINLHKWNNHHEFIAHPPNLITLAEVVPSTVDSSRLEIDSCAVYVTANGNFLEPNSAAFDAWRTLSRGYYTHLDKTHPRSWFDIGGNFLCYGDTKRHEHGIDPVSDTEWETSLQFWKMVRASGDTLSNSIIALSFGDQETHVDAINMSWLWYLILVTLQFIPVVALPTYCCLLAIFLPWFFILTTQQIIKLTYHQAEHYEAFTWYLINIFDIDKAIRYPTRNCSTNTRISVCICRKKILLCIAFYLADHAKRQSSMFTRNHRRHNTFCPLAPSYSMALFTFLWSAKPLSIWL